MEIYHAAQLGCRLGEGPLWHKGQKRLYGVDIEGQSIWSVDPETAQVERYALQLTPGCLGIREQRGFILAHDRAFAFWSPGSTNTEAVASLANIPQDVRFNDGAVDPGGRFWAGMMSTEGLNNALYRFDPDHSLRVMESGIGISNGIGWSPDQGTMYFTDSPRKTIYAYDFDLQSGDIANRRVWVDTQDQPGVPDGLCVDGEGCVWSARWDGWSVIRYDPHGRQMIQIRLPIQRPTSCAFGGKKTQTLFVTSAWTGLSEQERNNQPLAGDLFAIDTTITGQLPYHFQG